MIALNMEIRSGCITVKFLSLTSPIIETDILKRIFPKISLYGKTTVKLRLVSILLKLLRAALDRHKQLVILFLTLLLIFPIFGTHRYRIINLNFRIIKNATLEIMK